MYGPAAGAGRHVRWSLVVGAALTLGCAGSRTPLSLIGNPFTFVGSSGTPGGAAAGGESSFFDSGSRINVDPCSEPESRKFVRISMRNLATDSYIHYFLALIAFVNSDTYPDGAVCPDDIDLYTSFGYSEISEGAALEFGHYCIEGPALIYFHRAGQFRRGGGAGGSQLASAIAPAQGTNATFDSFFTSSGARVPVPNLILFHNPGTGEGANLKVSLSNPAPCDTGQVVIADPDCAQDAFYYVDEFDQLAGSIQLGVNSGRRTPSEIQGTGCQCTGFQDPFQTLAPSGTSAANARCYEFLRGGLIEYVFVRDDREPPFPQLLWRVTDQSGAEVHDFDPRAEIP